MASLIFSVIIVKKNSQFEMVCKDDSGCTSQIKQQKSKRWQNLSARHHIVNDKWQVTDYWPVRVCHYWPVTGETTNQWVCYYWPLRGAALLPLMSLTASQARWTLAVTSSTGSTLLTCDQICKPQHQPDMHKLTDHTTNSVSTDAFQVNLQCQVPSLLPQPFPEQDL